MAIVAGGRRCVKCGAGLAEAAKLCVQCGTHQSSGFNAKNVARAKTAGKATLALVVSGIVAAVCGGIWAWITIETQYEIGWVAIGLGFVTGAVVRVMAGGEASTKVGIGAAANALLGLVVAKAILSQYFENYINGFDVLWVVLACSTAFKLGAGSNE